MQEDKNIYTYNNNYILNDSLSDPIKKEFKSLLKKGIYKELHNRKLLSDAQLNSLLSSK